MLMRMISKQMLNGPMAPKDDGYIVKMGFSIVPGFHTSIPIISTIASSL